MNSFYITMSKKDPKDKEVDMFFGVTAKKRANGEIMFCDDHISKDFKTVEKIAEYCEKQQLTEDEFRKYIEDNKQ